MTNAEKYIGDEDEIDNFIDDFCEFAEKKDIDFKYLHLKETLVEFFQAKEKPILTEDDKYFLGLLPLKFEKVGKDKLGCLYITYHMNGTRYQYSLMPFNDLFNFIEYGEEYSINELLGTEKKRDRREILLDDIWCGRLGND